MARQLREQLDEEVTIIDKDDFGPAVKRAPGTPAVGTPPPSPPPSPPESPTEKPEETPPQS